MHITERSQSVKVKCYLIPSIGHPGKCKNMETLKHQCCQSFRVRGQGGRDGAQRIFKVVKLFCVILQWCICVIIHLSKPMEYTTSIVEPDVNCGLQLLIVC